MIPDFSSLILFSAAAFVLLIIPGPAVLYITAQSIDQGTKAGLVSTLGIALGSLFHVFGAALGLSSILVTSALAFNIVKYIGAGYLIYLGIKKILKKENIIDEINFKKTSYKKIFTQGILVNFLNPKTAIFFFAFLPQFVETNSTSPTIQMIFLGLIFTTMGIFSDAVYAILAGKVSEVLKKNEKIITIQKYVSGVIYILLGAITAFSGSKTK